jgi:hypothetical protein
MLVLILGALTFVVYKLLKNQGSNTSAPLIEKSDSQNKIHPEALLRIDELKRIKPKREDLFCPNHKDEPGEATCAICDTFYCKACIRPFKSLHFCREHIQLIMRHEWEEILTVKTSTQDPEEGVRLYEIKKVLFVNDDLPTYVETHYKINVDHDYIETYLVVFGMKEQVANLQDKFRQL